MLNLKPLGASEFDFNGDRLADLIEPVSGQPYVFLQTQSGAFQGRALAAPSSPLDADETTDWNLAGVGDFDGDGTTDDLYWRSRTLNQGAIMLVDAGEVRDTTFLADPLPAYFPEYADFNGDGTTDIFWRYVGDNAASEVWLMENGTIADSLPLPIVPTSWSSQVADFNADGQADLFWLDNATGAAEVWLLDSGTLLDPLPVDVPLNGNPQLVDIDGDGRTDILERERFTGRTQVWFWQASGLADAPTPIVLPGLEADGSVIFGNFNGDSRADVWLRNPASDTASLLIGQADGQFAVTTLTGLENRYVDRIQDFDGDGRTDVLMTNFLDQTSQLFLLDETGARQIRDVERVLLPDVVPPAAEDVTEPEGPLPSPVLQPVPAPADLAIDFGPERPAVDVLAPNELVPDLSALNIVDGVSPELDSDSDAAAVTIAAIELDL